MRYQVLARKWRPRKFADVVGQEHVLRALINALDTGRLHHAYLFTGTRGVGKTTLGRILAKSLNCERGLSSTPCGECSSCKEIDEGRFVDLLEVDAASRTKVEDTRDLLENVQYLPSRGRYKVYLIDEVHMLSGHSFNALLKTLEEPPPHVKFVLATTDPQKLPVTILSRCLKFNLKCIPIEQIVGHLQSVLKQEDVPFDAAAIKLVARAANGSMRDALSLVDQAIAYGGGSVRDADIRAMLGTLSRGDVVGLMQSVADQDGVGVLAHVDQFAQHGLDFANVLAEIVSLLHAIALAQLGDKVADAAGVDEPEVRALARTLSAEDVQLFYQIGLLGRRDLPLAPDARAGLEMVMLRMLAFRPASEVAALAVAPVPVPAPTPVPAAPVSKPNSLPVIAPPRREMAATPPSSAPPPAAQTVLPAAVPPALKAEAPTGDVSWEALVRSLPVSGVAKQLAFNSAFAGRNGDTITLIVQQAHAHMASRAVVEKLQAAVQSQLNEPVKINLSVGDSAAETPAKRDAREQSDRMKLAAEAIDADPTVQSLKQTFGAEVDPKSIRIVDT